MEEQVQGGPTTKERLLDAAARVIARDGFRGARLADVAREAGLTTGAVYSNFRDKEDLFLAAFDRVQAQRAVQNVNPTSADDLPGMISQIADGIRQFEADSELQVLNLELALLGTRNRRVHNLLSKSERDTIDNLAKLLPGAEDAVRSRAALMLALSNGLALMRMLAGDAVPLDGLEAALRRLAGLDE
ncbi:MAG TPA: helix-turn-helix domain-containing protein [Candidatus Dormibacteraeota bacterium]